MKAYLTWHNVPFRRVHSLEEIGEQCLQIEPGLRQAVDRAVPLTEYAWKFCYPGTVDEPTAASAQEALATAHALLIQLLSSQGKRQEALRQDIRLREEGRALSESDAAALALTVPAY
jgi:hypothetical protein